MKYEKMNNLFLRQSYLDSWEDYERSLKKKVLQMGYIILTAQMKHRQRLIEIRSRTVWKKVFFRKRQRMRFFRIPEGKRVGSGGATFQVMRYIADQEPERENPFKNRRILVIHSGW